MPSVKKYRSAPRKPSRDAESPEYRVPPSACTAATVRRLARRMTAFYEQRLRPTGLKLSQYSVLAHLSAEPQSLLELAARLELDRTTLTRSIKTLIENGWVTEVDGRDARQRLLALTAAGERFRDEARAAWKSAQTALDRRLGRDFVSRLHTQLDDALSQLKPALPEEN